MGSLYPMVFTPVFKDYPWGGHRLAQMRHVPSDLEIVAESWEVAGHKDGTTLVSNGPYAGWLLTDVQQELGTQLVGGRAAWAGNKFPLLIKLLDARQPLSVQVHPDDAYAMAHEGNELGKTEMWVVLDAQPDAEVILGITAGTTPEAFRQALTEGVLERCLHRIPVKAGDYICVPAGSLHAIMGGLIIAEIQQNSNATYRVYDWNRPGNDGKPRPLHVEKAMDVINFAQVEPSLPTPVLIEDTKGIRRWELWRNRYFVTERIEMNAGSIFHGSCDGESLEIWGVIQGAVNVDTLPLTAVEFTLLPATLGAFEITCQQSAILLRVYLG